MRSNAAIALARLGRPEAFDALAQMLALPDVRVRLFNEGAETSRLTVDEFNTFVRADTARWAQVIKSAGIKPD